MVKFLIGKDYPHLCDSCQYMVDQCYEVIRIVGEDTDDNEAPLMFAADHGLLCDEEEGELPRARCLTGGSPRKSSQSGQIRRVFIWLSEMEATMSDGETFKMKASFEVVASSKLGDLFRIRIDPEKIEACPACGMKPGLALTGYDGVVRIEQIVSECRTRCPACGHLGISIKEGAAVIIGDVGWHIPLDFLIPLSLQGELRSENPTWEGAREKLARAKERLARVVAEVSDLGIQVANMERIIEEHGKE